MSTAAASTLGPALGASATAMTRQACLQVDRSTLTVDGEPLEHPEGMLVLLHKPRGYTCSKRESEGALVFDLLPHEWLARKPPIVCIGRCARVYSSVRLPSSHIAQCQVAADRRSCSASFALQA
jgi:16S rRNA pseudouridine516 synthase